MNLLNFMVKLSVGFSWFQMRNNNYTPNQRIKFWRILSADLDCAHQAEKTR